MNSIKAILAILALFIALSCIVNGEPLKKVFSDDDDDRSSLYQRGITEWRFKRIMSDLMNKNSDNEAETVTEQNPDSYEVLRYKIMLSLLDKFAKEHNKRK